jgi:activator of HSP90 ATPase
MSDNKNVRISEITALLRHTITLIEGITVLKFRNRRNKAVKKWRSRAWSINPNETELILINNKNLQE